MKYKNLMSIFVVSLFFVGCATNEIPKPKIKQKKQYLTKTVTNNHYKINEFKKMMQSENLEPIYVYIDSNLKSEVPSNEIPNIKTITYSLLSDFGEKVIVVTSPSAINNYFADSKTKNRVFILDGAITSFDSGIISQSSSTKFNLSIESNNGKKKANNKFKNKKKTSQLIGDFYFKRPDAILHKSTSSIMIRETNEGYSFGISLYGLSLGVSSYKNIKDGMGLSVRKLIEGTLIDLISKAIGIKSYQVIPEIQIKKLAKKPIHLSNYDFCSDMNRIVFYIEPLKDIKFNAFGMSHESEQNKISCLKDLYNKSIQKKEKIVIKLKTVIGENMSISKAHKNARIIRKELSKINIPRDLLVIENKHVKEECLKDKEYCDFIKNRIEIEKIIKR